MLTITVITDQNLKDQVLHFVKLGLLIFILFNLSSKVHNNLVTKILRSVFMKRFLCLLLATVLCLSFVACGKKNSKNNGEISVFYFTYSDAYISSVRTALDKALKNAGLKFNDYDANGNQSSQTEQIDVAISKGSQALVVNVVDTGSDDAALNIIDKARAANLPVIFFNRSVEESVVKSYDKCVFVGTDYEMAGHMQGQVIGDYLVKNFDTVDLNKDGKISYVMFKGQEGNMEAIARTRFAVEDADKILTEAGKPKLQFYDAANANKYLVDQDGLWSSAAANNYMGTILAKYSESNKNMVELVIANNDEMAMGAVSALQGAGYNKQGGKVIPVFGVDATPAAQTAIANGSMTGTIKQDAEGMAKVIASIVDNFRNDRKPLDGIEESTTVGGWRVNIPYSAYTKE